MISRRRGMSLIETIYATLLLGFIALFLLNLYPSSFVAIKRGESTFTADNFACTILEDLHSRNFANVSTYVGPPGALTYVSQTWGGITYSPVVQLIYLPAPGTLPFPPDPKHIMEATVTVSWEYNSITRQVVHTAYLHNVTR